MNGWPIIVALLTIGCLTAHAIWLRQQHRQQPRTLDDVITLDRARVRRAVDKMVVTFNHDNDEDET